MHTIRIPFEHWQGLNFCYQMPMGGGHSIGGAAWDGSRWLLNVYVLDQTDKGQSFAHVAFRPGDDAAVELAARPELPVPVRGEWGALVLPPTESANYDQFDGTHALEQFLCFAYDLTPERSGVAVLHYPTRRHCVIVPRPHARYDSCTVSGDGLTVCAVGAGNNPPVVVFDNPLV